MLNGDAHHSLKWEVEQRIGRCRQSKRTHLLPQAVLTWSRTPQSISEAAKFVHPLK
jgi:hypothetical protein